jgi:hypothetical protein
VSDWRFDPKVRLTELEVEARYARERCELYRARSYSSRPTSAARLRELEQRSERAKARVERAKVTIAGA